MPVEDIQSTLSNSNFKEKKFLFELERESNYGGKYFGKIWIFQKGKGDIKKCYILG